MNAKPALQGLYGITDTSLLPDDDALLGAVESALRGGMRVLQYRDKQSDPRSRLRQAAALQSLCADHDALLIINDDVRLARSLQAHGVHLGRNDIALQDARAELGQAAIIGVSCYNNLQRAHEAQQQGADYVALGRFFPSSTKPNAVAADIDLIGQAKQRLTVPVCAIGGITLNNAGALVAAGVDMVAVIQGLFSAADVEQRARGFSLLFAA